MLPISPQCFNRLSGFMKSKYGIDLSKKEQLITGRLSPTILSMGFESFEDYTSHIMSKATSADIEIMLNRITTNYTYFMRDREHFDFFRDIALPEIERKRKDKVLSIWSAGCSSGEEPYTLSMIIKDHFKNRHDWDTRVLATDISASMLSTAKKGIYQGESLKDLPADYKKNYFRRVDSTDFSVCDEIKKNVIFRNFNLMDPITFKLKFDVIFCRNVMIYFDGPTKEALLKRFYDACNPGAYFFVGHSETFGRNAGGFEYIMPSLYQKK